MDSKELVIQFIRKDDGTINVKAKPSETSFTEFELYMAYRYLHQTLNNLHFDWSIEGTVDTEIIKEEK